MSLSTGAELSWGKRKKKIGYKTIKRFKFSF